jgi:hypothetical protein
MAEEKKTEGGREQSKTVREIVKDIETERRGAADDRRWLEETVRKQEEKKSGEG